MPKMDCKSGVLISLPVYLWSRGLININALLEIPGKVREFDEDWSGQLENTKGVNAEL